MSTDDPADGALGWQRLDRWLWCARFFKTRAMAARLAAQGRIRINRQRTEKAHARIRPGDVLTLGIGPSVRVVRVLSLGVRRGPAEAAQRLYEDLDPAQS
ncbi:RNA-binding S4 domain-containing protein [Elioraea sp.]|uniref:RNA-binding S4 domain-containing protein n=1 Tax=Elioraea sp. TaxID=2185103 RepID=UPI003F72C6B2